MRAVAQLRSLSSDALAARHVTRVTTPLLPLHTQGDPNDPNSVAGPYGGRGYAVPATYDDVDGSSVWMLKRYGSPFIPKLRI